MYINKQDLASNNLQYLICHETKPNQTFHYCLYSAIRSSISTQLSEIVSHTLEKF